jgi:hypothetical protein
MTRGRLRFGKRHVVARPCLLSTSAPLLGAHATVVRNPVTNLNRAGLAVQVWPPGLAVAVGLLASRVGVPSTVAAQATGPARASTSAVSVHLREALRDLPVAGETRAGYDRDRFSS